MIILRWSNIEIKLISKWLKVHKIVIIFRYIYIYLIKFYKLLYIIFSTSAYENTFFPFCLFVCVFVLFCFVFCFFCFAFSCDLGVVIGSNPSGNSFHYLLTS